MNRRTGLLSLALKAMLLAANGAQLLVMMGAADDGALSTSTSSTTTTTTSPPAELPDFLEPIGNHTVPVGKDAQLSCKISKLGRYKTAWLRFEDKGILTIHTNVITRNYRVGLINNQLDKSTADGDQEFVLTIKNVEPTDRGGYMCQINSVPMKYAIGHLEVLTPPVFEPTATSGEPPASSTIVTVRENGSASLSCRASGRPTPQISWRREDNKAIQLNGNVISGADQPEADGPLKVEGSSLNLTQVGRANSGAYLCIASNGVQPSASRRQVLDVQYRPVIRLAQRGVFAAARQPEVRLSCFIELNPAGSYHWVRVGTAGSAPEPAYRGAGHESSVQLDDQTLIEQESITNNSNKYELTVAPTGRNQEVQMSLVVRNVERQDFGLYKCIARNELGLQSAELRLLPGSASPPSSAPAPGSFSLNNLFRFGAKPEPAGSEAEPSTNAPKVAAASTPSRTMTRSSWVSRSTNGQQLQQPSEVAARSGALHLSPLGALTCWSLIACAGLLIGAGRL